MGAKIDEAIQKLLVMWDTGDMPELIKKTMLARQAGDRPCDHWSLANQILMYLSLTEDARGFRQWEQVGRKVKKGAKAIYISGPLKTTIEVENEETKQKEKIQIIRGFKDIPVFRIEDTEGEPVGDRPNYQPPILPPLMDVADAWGIPVIYGAGDGRAYGSYMFSKDRSLEKIILNTHDVSTFFHEISHAAHNRIRPLKDGQDQIQEIVAETCGAVLCLLYGYEGYVGNARNYVAHYGKVKPEEATKAVMRALGDIEKVLELILMTTNEITEKSTG
ncbi:ArdC-like ssDNA-binding domain-containing protein [Alicyclobacillus fodiniaquatilis]|uniref:ArdC-like ssDNA-binding domain-containing protein n=1 Tax=Alicyclobacillus fodiniaquatilis TaxID=1661150 RepID=A0ABW4JE04_9BACL